MKASKTVFGEADMQLRFGQVLARTKATLCGFRLVRNLADLHIRFAELLGHWVTGDSFPA